MNRRDFFRLLPLGGGAGLVLAKTAQGRRQVIRDTLRCPNPRCGAVFRFELERGKLHSSFPQCTECMFVMDTSHIAERITKGDWEWVE